MRDEGWEVGVRGEGCSYSGEARRWSVSWAAELCPSPSRLRPLSLIATTGER